MDSSVFVRGNCSRWCRAAGHNFFSTISHAQIEQKTNNPATSFPGGLSTLHLNWSRNQLFSRQRQGSEMGLFRSFAI
jgi:hypothetical protein